MLFQGEGDALININIYASLLASAPDLWGTRRGSVSPLAHHHTKYDSTQSSVYNVFLLLFFVFSLIHAVRISPEPKPLKNLLVISLSIVIANSCTYASTNDGTITSQV